MIATLVFGMLAISGLLVSRDSFRQIADIGDVRRTLVSRASAENPDWQHTHLLAYARRNDELHRLLELPSGRPLTDTPVVPLAGPTAGTTSAPAVSGDVADTPPSPVTGSSVASPSAATTPAEARLGEPNPAVAEPTGSNSETVPPGDPSLATPLQQRQPIGEEMRTARSPDQSAEKETAQKNVVATSPGPDVGATAIAGKKVRRFRRVPRVATIRPPIVNPTIPTSPETPLGDVTDRFKNQ